MKQSDISKKDFVMAVEEALGVKSFDACWRNGIDTNAFTKQRYDSLMAETQIPDFGLSMEQDTESPESSAEEEIKHCAYLLHKMAVESTYKKISKKAAEAILAAMDVIDSDMQGFSTFNPCGIGEVNSAEFAAQWNNVHSGESISSKEYEF